eukprot:5783636-Prorocentrum_lima.AAC.1
MDEEEVAPLWREARKVSKSSGTLVRRLGRGPEIRWSRIKQITITYHRFGGPTSYSYGVSALRFQIALVVHRALGR